MNESIIPKGIYCYSKEICPYFTRKQVGEIRIAYCKFLKQGSIGHLIDKQFDYLKIYHKTSSDEDIYNLYPLELLWDQIKECGINEEIRDEEN